MEPKLSRRDVLRSVGAGTLLLANSTLQQACLDDLAPPQAVSPLTYDPERAWWMQNNFEPVLEERDVLGLEVTGQIPNTLTGTYVRTGPNPKLGDRGHWFMGDGMLHGVRIEAGRAVWYRNRWVQTPVLDRLERAMPTERLTDTPSNISLVQHAGRLLSLGEIGLPFEVTPELETLGAYDFAGKLKTFMTAHPKIDPVTRDMHMFGYGIAAPYLTYHRVNVQGELVRSEPITLSRPTMIHDLQITPSWIVFFDLPLRVDSKAALQQHPVPFRWQPENGARIGLMPHSGGDKDVIWIEIEPCFFFHAWNAYEDASGRVVLEACRYEQMWADGSNDFDALPARYRFTLDPVQRSVVQQQLDDRTVEFPQVDARRVGLEHRYAYGLTFAPERDASSSPTALLTFGGHELVKYDRHSDSSVTFDLGPAHVAGEALFVPSAASAAEDDGYLMSIVLDRRSKTSRLEIFHAQQLERGAIASVKLPGRVPYGVHGYWVSG